MPIFHDVDSVRTAYYITDGEKKVLAGGSLASGTLPVGKNISIGTLVFPLDKITKPHKTDADGQSQWSVPESLGFLGVSG